MLAAPSNGGHNAEGRSSHRLEQVGERVEHQRQLLERHFKPRRKLLLFLGVERVHVLCLGRGWWAEVRARGRDGRRARPRGCERESEREGERVGARERKRVSELCVAFWRV